MTPNQTPPDPITDSAPLVCHNCGAIFLTQLLIQEIAGAQILRGGSAIFSRIECTCIHCGAVTHWAIRDRVLKEIAKFIKTYKPE